ncbi:CBS domain-containing protein [Parashewanella curva]|uniref:CBS domain-containing protein n=1 Tax=Parashewanella curva TaxID=2338552 RepID=A0A3L8PTB0_9GAMM|nr:CBS domain-containing protein [Parashewanella curva]RLV58651.1 CBS domain-containing protein [Parashewanella curva]
MNEMSVKEHMQAQFPIIHPETEISLAIDLLNSFNLIGAPVVDSNKRLLAYLSEHELLKPMLHASYHCDSGMTVADLMRGEPLSVSEDTSVITLAEQMLGDKPKNYPVVDENGRVTGIITRTRILSALAVVYNNCKAV